MSHTCQFNGCGQQAESAIRLKGVQTFKVYACLKHKELLLETIEREFGKDKILSDERIGKEQYEYVGIS